jgi:signal transduction histidine kinase
MSEEPEYLQKIGGEISVKSALGKGATFTICLPVWA